MERLDEKLAEFNALLKEWAARINANIAILVIFLNGFLIALATTGYLGDKSVYIWSLAGGLYIWQFLLMILILTALVRPNTELLLKFMVAGVLGFAAQWQGFAMQWPTEQFQPIVEHKFAIFLFFAGAVGALRYCFSGNQQELKTDNLRSIKAA
jgi:hypothetical protein